MSGIVYHTDKRYGTTYAYREGSVVDPETGRRKRTREYLGRVDPNTGEIVPKAAGGGRNRRALGTGGPGEGADLAAFKRALDERDGDVERLRGENARLRDEVERLSGINQELKERNKVLLAAYAEVEGLMASLREQASEWLTDS